MEKFEIVKMLITVGDEISALVFCQDEDISYQEFEKLLKELNPNSKLLS